MTLFGSSRPSWRAAVGGGRHALAELTQGLVKRLGSVGGLEVAPEHGDSLHGRGVLGSGERLQIAAGRNAGRIDIAFHTAIEDIDHGNCPCVDVGDPSCVDAHRLSERPHVLDKARGLVDLLERLGPAVLPFHLTESVDEGANRDERREHPVAKLVEGVGELVGSRAERVEVRVVGGDQGGRVTQLAAHLAGLPGGLGLLEHLAGGSGDAAHQCDVVQLAHPRRQLFHIGERPRAAQILRRLDEDELLDHAADREVPVHRLIAHIAIGVGGQILAVVVFVLDQQGTGRQTEKDQEADREMHDGFADDMYPGLAPPSAGHVFAGLYPATPSGEHDHGWQQGN